MPRKREEWSEKRRINMNITTEKITAAARRLCSLTARTLAAGLLLRHAPAPVAELYCATRLGWSGDRVFGEVPPGTATAGIVESITPSPR